MTNTNRNCFQHINHEDENMTRICNEVKRYKNIPLEEKAALYDQYIAGGRKSGRLFNRLFNSDLRIVLHCVGQVQESPFLTQPDMFSIGSVALMNVVRKFDITNGIDPFFSYAQTAIMRAIMDVKKKYSNKSRVIRNMKEEEEEYGSCWQTDCEWQHMTVHYDSEWELERECYLSCSSYHDYDREEDRMTMRYMVDTLEDKDRSIIERKYGLKDGFEQSDVTIGRDMGISGQAVGKHEKRIMGELRKKIIHYRLCT